MTKTTKKETNHARANAAGWWETIQELSKRISSEDVATAEKAREEALESVLAVNVRSGWYQPGERQDKPEEFCILLTTGGPALRIIGDLDGYGEPERSRMEYQDWGTPWTEYGPAHGGDLELFVSQFFFGE